MNRSQLIKSIRFLARTLGFLLVIVGVYNGFPIIKTMFLVVALIMGPVFCGWICPFGSLQDISRTVGKTIGIKKRVLPPLLQKFMVIPRYLFLLVSVLISADFIFTLFSYDPKSNWTLFLSGYSVTVIGWLVVVGFLVISMFYERPFCNHVCIEGAKYGLLSALRPVAIERAESNCVDCGKCNRACPMHIDIMSKERVNSAQCISCMSCVAACPKENALKMAVGYKGSFKLKKIPAISYVLAIMALFVLFAENVDISGLISTEGQAVNETSAIVEEITGNVSINEGEDAVDTVVADTNSDASADTSYNIGDAVNIADGTYTGTGTGFRGDVTVSVVVSNEVITSIDIVSHSDDAKWFNNAVDTIINRILSEQTVDVDSVSGSTYSSIGIQSAVADALTDAGGIAVAEVDTTVSGGGHGHRRH